MALQAASQLSLPSTGPASCKPTFVALDPPLSSLPTQQLTGRLLHLRELHITHSVGNERQIYPSPQQGASSYWLLSASIFLLRAYRHTSASRLCFAQIDRCLVFHLLVHHPVLHDDHVGLLLTTAQVLQAQSRERLPLGTAERRPGAARLNVSVVCICTSAHIGGGPPRQRTNAGSSFFWDTQASLSAKMAYTNLNLNDFVFELTFPVNIFSESSAKTIRNYFE